MKTIEFNRVSAEDQRLVELVEEITARLQAGETCDVDQYLNRYPEYADRLRGWIGTMTAMADLGHSLGAGTASRTALGSQSEIRNPQSEINADSPQFREPGAGILGDFRILGEIGRGGMGVVYEANQISLGRRVALKVLPFAAMLDPQQLNRFKNEARAAATLDHPGIVSVYSVGSDRGVHYFAMQLIEGQSLAATIADLRSLAATDSQMREHQDVSQLSRDLASGEFAPSGSGLDAPQLFTNSKPGERADREPTKKAAVEETNAEQANISTHLPSCQTQFFRSAAVLAVQAALALDHAHERGILHRDIKPGNLLLDSHGKLWITDFGLARIQADAGMTMTGDLLGTLRYMPPEQALAKRVVIDQRADIYSLGATLYELLTLQPAVEGADREEVLRKIAFEEPPPPRRIRSSIPTDLEVIVSKAMRKNPAERYETARELADDLARFLNHEPIKAKRPTLAECATKWARRHRGITWTALAALVVLTVALGVSTAQIAQQRQVAVAEAQRADAEARRAEAHFKKAREAVDRMLTKAAGDLADVPHAEQVRRALLEDALEFYQGFLKQKADDPQIHVETALAYQRVGEIQVALGNREKASQASRQAVEILKQLSSDVPSESKYRVMWAEALQTLAQTTFWTGTEEDIRIRHQALEVAKGLIHDFPDNPESWAELATAYEALGNGSSVAGNKRLAADYLRKAVAAREKLSKDFPQRPNQSGIVHSHHWLGAALVDLGQLEEGERHLQQAFEINDRMLKQEPASQEWRYNAVTLAAWKGNARRRMGDLDQAKQHYLQGIEGIEKLREEFPNYTEYLRRLAGLYFDLSMVHTAAEREQEAIDALRQAIVQQEKLTTADPGVSEFVCNLSRRQYELGVHLYLQEEQSVAAVTQFRNSLKHLERYLKNHDDPRGIKQLSNLLVNCPAIQFRDVSRAKYLLKGVLQKTPQDKDAWIALGAAYYRTGQWEEAIDAIERGEPSVHNGVVSGRFFLAMSHWQAGNEQEAHVWHRRAVEGMKKIYTEGEVNCLPEIRLLRMEAEALLEIDDPKTNAPTDP